MLQTGAKPTPDTSHLSAVRLSLMFPTCWLLARILIDVGCAVDDGLPGNYQHAHVLDAHMEKARCYRKRLGQCRLAQRATERALRHCRRVHRDVVPMIAQAVWDTRWSEEWETMLGQEKKRPK